ncbi:MAG: cyclic nucleotide-binding domain-containing protein, partial [Pseudomonadota bacterium]
ELLTYYNQAQDMSLRWETVMEKFSPPDVIDEALFAQSPDAPTDLRGPISLKGVSVADADGNLVLDNISIEIPQGALVAIAAPSEEDRHAIADVLTREITPVSGSVSIASQPLNALNQTTIAARIGHASSLPVLFRGTFGENAMMPASTPPLAADAGDASADLEEALAAGNSTDSFTGNWLNPARANLGTEDELRAWWLELIEAIGSGGAMFRKSLDQPLNDKISDALQHSIVSIRPQVWEAVQAAGLDRYVYRFDPNLYNPGLPVTGNLFYATLKRPMTHLELSQQTHLFELIRRLGLEDELLQLSRDVAEVLSRIFGRDGTEHPLFRKLGLDPGLFETSVALVQSNSAGKGEQLSDADKAILITLPAQITAEQIGPAFSEEMQARILKQRIRHHDTLEKELGVTYAPLSPDHVAEGMSLLENALYGIVSDSAGPRVDELRQIVSGILEEEGLKPTVIDLIYDLPLTLGGANLPAIFAEPLSLIRAAIKKPDILVMEQVMASADQAQRILVNKNLRALLPDTTLINIDDSFPEPDRFDVYVEISQGRMQQETPVDDLPEDTAATADLQRKLRALETTDMFSGLSRKQLRLLAFGARWFNAEAGEVIFRKNDDPVDGAYMILDGTAGLFDPDGPSPDKPVAQVGPGTLVGELGLIRKVPRALTMRAESDIEALRLGAEDFLAVVENDAPTAFKLLQVVAGYSKR